MAETIPGGLYRLPDGTTVDAHGHPAEAPTAEAPKVEPKAEPKPAARKPRT